ncbi:metalloprotease family protein [Haloterrigena salifodinae]|uniref:metalloprotease family protein n=1 Tax=Haloterrigena salifodinae TaxID=2675099 RepID=UPI000F877CBF|nr:metalloprotease family protein [Haloterrigena salifodinae]
MIPDAASPLVATLAVLVAVTVIVSVVGSITRVVMRLLAAPGVVVHELAHKQVCHLVGVPVKEVVYFRFGDPPGYVRHAQPGRYRESFAISVAPFLVNTVVSVAAFLGFAALASSLGIADALATATADPIASVTALRDGLAAASSGELALAIALGWLGLAVGVQAFPSTGDANTLWTHSRSEWRRRPVVLLGVPVVVVIYVVNLLSWLWADVLYALGLCLLAFYAVGGLGF